MYTVAMPVILKLSPFSCYETIIWFVNPVRVFDLFILFSLMCIMVTNNNFYDNDIQE